MKQILLGMFAVMVALAFSTTTFAQGIPPTLPAIPIAPAGGAEKPKEKAEKERKKAAQTNLMSMRLSILFAALLAQAKQGR